MVTEKDTSEKNQDVTGGAFHDFFITVYGLFCVLTGIAALRELDWAFRGYAIVVFGVISVIVGHGALPNAESLDAQLGCLYFYYGGLGMIPFGILIRCIGEGIRETNKISSKLVC